MESDPVMHIKHPSIPYTLSVSFSVACARTELGKGINPGAVDSRINGARNTLPRCNGVKGCVKVSAVGG